jgi:hypothetical protein
MLLDHLLRLLLGLEETAPRCTFDTDNGGVHRLLHWTRVQRAGVVAAADGSVAETVLPCGPCVQERCSSW